ncbi:PREDICTED: phosphatidylinositol/phosphatidylcholine transfer protein SFH11 isoform X2 [Ipomoea nil]|uniref:phosphatidylinositol/phosphatidylcholine transfer protein SFH11 isoform X2 n=1 Tax=Ipomoea nil TaxID=35883 RepID=UPI000900CE36|nr:PREDICTED: phosphatidylinositol/phosphatidylcholine transfer protein SFH11 isoform X2 [Ipomoea nil]
MNKPKAFLKDIFIGGSKQSSNLSREEGQSAKETDKILHPPIETYWYLPPQEESNKAPKQQRSRRLSFSFKRRLRKSKSLQMILQGSHDPKDEEKVDSFRDFIFPDIPLSGKQFDYHTLLRFLRMRDYDMVKAKEMFLNYLKWREEFRVDAICKEFKYEEYREVKGLYPHGFHGVDRYGRPIYIDRVGMVDINKLLEVTTIERFVKYHVSEQEKTLNLRYPACSLAAKKHIASTTSILDVKDVGMSNFSKPARYLFLEIQKIDSNYYPETLHRLFIINAGSGFKVLWKAIRAFLDQRTLAKIQVLGNNYLKNLVEVIDPSNLPTFLGGNCTCSEHGGCLSSDKGPWNDPEVTDILQAMLEADEQCDNNPPATRDIFDGDTENVQIKDVYDVTPEREPSIGQSNKAQVFDPHFMQKVSRIEAVVNDTNAVLQTLTEHMEDLKRGLL